MTTATKLELDLLGMLNEVNTATFTALATNACRGHPTRDDLATVRKCLAGLRTAGRVKSARAGKETKWWRTRAGSAIVRDYMRADHLRAGVIAEERTQDLKQKLDQAAAESSRQLRHLQAVAASDVQFMRQSLLDAAQRFSDMADILRREGRPEHVGFLLASAQRYRLAAEGKG